MSNDPERFPDDQKAWGHIKDGYSKVSPTMDDRVVRNQSADDDIIELVDVVREGEIPHTETKDLSLLLEQEQGREKEAEDAFAPPDFDFEAPDSFEPTGEDVSDLTEDDLDLVMAGLVDAEVEPEPSEPSTQEPLPISQEGIEAALAGVITPVVERVVRETVAEVTERVIREAIESLKKSLDSKA